MTTANAARIKPHNIVYRSIACYANICVNSIERFVLFIWLTSTILILNTVGHKAMCYAHYIGFLAGLLFIFHFSIATITHDRLKYLRCALIANRRIALDRNGIFFSRVELEFTHLEFRIYLSR